MSETRDRIQRCVHREPGINFNEISRRLEIATGQTQHHLARLQRSGRLTREEICGRTHFYPPTYSLWERETIALLRRETTREIVAYLLRNDEVYPAVLAEQLGIARSTAEWHLSNLIEHDIVTKQTVADGPTARTVVRLTKPDAVYRLLREVEPGFADKLVDRFTRLADDLLE